MAVILLSSLAEVRNALDITGQNQDGVLKTMLRTVSADIARKINRADKIDIRSRTELKNVSAEQKSFALRADPIQAVASIIWDLQQDFANGTTFDPVDFVIEAEEGLVTFQFHILPAWTARAPKSLQVIYTGGIASNLTGLRESNFAELEEAALLTIQSTYKRQRLDPGEFRSSGQGGSVSVPALTFPPRAREIIRVLRRRPVGS